MSNMKDWVEDKFTELTVVNDMLLDLYDINEEKAQLMIEAKRAYYNACKLEKIKEGIKKFIDDLIE